MGLEVILALLGYDILLTARAANQTLRWRKSLAGIQGFSTSRPLQVSITIPAPSIVVRY